MMRIARHLLLIVYMSCVLFYVSKIRIARCEAATDTAEPEAGKDDKKKDEGTKEEGTKEEGGEGNMTYILSFITGKDENGEGEMGMTQYICIGILLFIALACILAIVMAFSGKGS